jgi:uncharacterized protein YhaN
MIIKNIYIEGCGIFRDFPLDGLDKGVNVILGPNEAGKSTLLKFIRYTLFGYPRLHADRMTPLNGGNHGGRIIGNLSSGEEVVFERKGTDEILVTLNGNPTGNQVLWDQLLGHAHRELYNNIYSFTLDELTGIASLNDSGMQDKIFSIGLGLGKTSLGEITGALAETADKIYKRRGRTQHVASILGEIERINGKISGIRTGLPEYERLKREIGEKQAELSRQRGELDARTLERDRLVNNLKCYDSFLTISGIDRELETLPAPAAYPENGIPELQRIEQEWKGCHATLTGLREGSAGEPGTDELEKEIGRISFNEELLAESEKVVFLGKMLEAYKVNVAENEKDRIRAAEIEQAITSGIADISGTWTRENVLDFKDITIHQDRVCEFRDRFGTIAERKRTLEAKADAMLTQRSTVHMNGLTVLVSVFLLCGSVLLFFYRHYVPGAITLLLSLVTFFSRKYLFGGGSANTTGQQMEILVDEEKSLKQAYGSYLSEQMHLPGDLSPETALKILGMVASLKKELDEQQKIRDRMVQERAPKIEAFESQVKALAGKIATSTGEESVEVLANRILAAYETGRSLHDRKLRLEEDLGRKRREYSRVASLVEALEKEKQALFGSIGAGDRETFLDRYTKNNRARELHEERKATLRNIELIAGRDKSVEVIGYLESHEKGFIEQEARELSARITAAGEELNEIGEQVGKAKNELERIEGQSELAECLTELETQRHLLQTAYEEWLVNRTALEMLGQVKSRYEEEKQPELIRRSGAFFEKITSGRYNGIHVSIDERQILVSDPRGAVKKIDQLSRGTREQLLISLRLGLIHEYELRSEPLPVVIDEVLVNFDPGRAKELAGILVEFAADRQILVFTCHPSMADIFENKARTIVLEDHHSFTRNP